MRKKIILLGSTGALGKLTVKLLEKHKKHFSVVGLSAKKNEKLLLDQAKKLKTKNTAISSKGQSLNIKAADIVINVISGIEGIKGTKEAIKQKKILLLGNKESAVVQKISIKKHKIIPLDSEHNAIFEILKANPKKEIKEIYLPCSGGPFYNKKSIKKITPQQAIKHPKWEMGEKISVESATLINKGLEIIEAHHLFQVPLSKIKVFLHPECKIHGIVRFEKETIAYFGPTNMKDHIENALLRAINKTPKRKIKEINEKSMQFVHPKNPNLTGIEIVLNNFKKNKKMLGFLKKEEETINAFLSGEICFTDIFKILKK